MLVHVSLMCGLHMSIMKKTIGSPRVGPTGGRFILKRLDYLRTPQCGSIDVLMMYVLAGFMLSISSVMMISLVRGQISAVKAFGIRENGKTFCSIEFNDESDQCIPPRNDHFAPNQSRSPPRAFCELFSEANTMSQYFGFGRCD